MKASSLHALLGLAPPVMRHWNQAEDKAIQYTSVGGYFLQDDPNTNPSGFDYAEHNFGLVERKYPTDATFDPQNVKSQWERLDRWVYHLNNNCQRRENVRYKVLFFGRHGQGYHNVAETFYGTPAWNEGNTTFVPGNLADSSGHRCFRMQCYWAELEGNGTITWADALLTPVGFGESEKAKAFYETLYEQQNMPHFESYYSSPLRRCIQTANSTFASMKVPPERPFVPTIKELFREDISIHTCDRRSTKSELEKFVPGWKFEPQFTEKDGLWEGDKGETQEHQIARSKAVLDDVFIHDESTWISVTSHSGEIGALLKALNHRPFSLSTGQIVPVLVKAELLRPVPTTAFTGFTPEATCNRPPVTSLPDQGCVCSTTDSTTGSIPSPTLGGRGLRTRKSL